MEECAELLQSLNVRLFGDRFSKVRYSQAQRTRKAIVDCENGLIESSAIDKNDQREIDNFKGKYRFLQKKNEKSSIHFL